jgi:DNA repair protein RadC
MSFVYKAYEVDIRRSDPSEPPRTISNTEELVAGIKEYYNGLDREVILSCVMDDANRLLGIYEVAKGATGNVEFAFATALRPAVLMGATKVILVHNHPSGDIAPSDQDVQMAKGMFICASMLDMESLDSIIIAGSSYGSVHSHPEFQRWVENDLAVIAQAFTGEGYGDAQTGAV